MARPVPCPNHPEILIGGNLPMCWKCAERDAQEAHRLEDLRLSRERNQLLARERRAAARPRNQGGGAGATSESDERARRGEAVLSADPDAALQQAEKGLEDDPTSIRCRFLAADAAFRMEDAEAVRKHLTVGLRTQTATVQEIETLLDRCVKYGERDLFVQEALKEGRSSSRKHWALAKAFRGECGEAVESCVAEGDAKTLRLLGSLDDYGEFKGKIQAALRELEQSVASQVARKPASGPVPQARSGGANHPGSRHRGTAPKKPSLDNVVQQLVRKHERLSREAGKLTDEYWEQRKSYAPSSGKDFLNILAIIGMAVPLGGCLVLALTIAGVILGKFILGAFWGGDVGEDRGGAIGFYGGIGICVLVVVLGAIELVQNAIKNRRDYRAGRGDTEFKIVVLISEAENALGPHREKIEASEYDYPYEIRDLLFGDAAGIRSNLIEHL